MTSLLAVLRKWNWKKWGRRALAATLVLLVLFMIASNVMLRTRLFRNLMAFDPESMTLDYDSAYSWFPGRVHVEGLTIRGSDSHVQWFLTVDRADTFMNPLAFAKRRFSASHVSADGVTFHFRTRYAPEQVTPELVAALPKIPGFSDPPLKVPVPPEPSDEDYALWSVDLEDVTAHHVSDVWVDTVRETGEITVRGRWLFRPLRELDFGPSTLEIVHADVKNAGRVIVANAAGTADIRIFPYDVRVPQGLDVLHEFSGDLKVSWETPLSEVLTDVVDADTARFRKGLASVRGELRLDHGVLASGTKMRADIDDADLRLATAGLAAQTTATADFRVDDPSTLVGTVTTSSLHVEKNGAPPATALTTVTTLTSKHLDLAHGFDDAHVRIEARGARTESLERWASSSTEESPWATGTASVDADIESDVNPADFHGRVDAAVKDVSIRVGELRIMSDVNVAAEISHLSPSKKRFTGSVNAHTPDPVLTVLGDLRVRGRIEVSGRVDAELGKKTRIDASGSEVTWRDARADLNSKPLFVAPEIAVRSPRFVDDDGKLEGSVTLDAPRIELADLASLQQLIPFPESTAIVGGTASADAHASIDLTSKTAQGNVNLLARSVDLRIDKQPVFGNLQLGAHAVRRGDVTDFSGTTMVFARSSDPREPRAAEPWSATFTLAQATLSGGEKPLFHAIARGVATDASPATLFVSSATGVPAWITNAFRMRGLKVSAEVFAAPSFLAVRGLDARGDGSFVDFEYSRRGPMKDGAIYLGTGILTGGIDLAGGSARLIVFGPQAWFQRDVAKIRANEASLP